MKILNFAHKEIKMNTKPGFRFALFGSDYQGREVSSVRQVLDSLAAHGSAVFVDRPYYDYVTKVLQLSFRPEGIFEGCDFETDFALSIGGDGTFLKVASRVGSKGMPIIGVKTGRLGFLADVLPDDIDETLDALCNGDYQTEEHAVIELEADGEPLGTWPYALNDIAVLKRDSASMITIDAAINGEHLVTYQADGLIVSTPTGSTAYSLSNGGPVIVPQTDVLCLTPVAPHSLTIRPVVISGDSVVTLTVESRSHSFLAAIDGRSVRLEEGTRLTIRRAPFGIAFVKRGEQSYFSTLREKMMWGVDARKK